MKWPSMWLKNGADLTALDVFGWTALNVLAGCRDVKIARLIIVTKISLRSRLE